MAKPGFVSMSLTSATVNDSVEIYSVSKQYIYTVLKATVINIFYHRLNIDDEEFVTKTFHNVSFQTPLKLSHNAYIRQFGAYMAACKDAIKKNYLKEFYLYFVDADTEDVLEYYRFSFEYVNRNETNSSQNEENLIDITCELLRTLQDLETLPKLEGCNINTRAEFTYFEDTPAEYEPPRFEAVAEPEALVKKLNRNSTDVALRSLRMDFHKKR